MKAVVMAGGEGSRLRPLTVTRPKPMVPIVGRPVMEHILNLLKGHGITEVVVTVQYMASAIEDFQNLNNIEPKLVAATQAIFKGETEEEATALQVLNYVRVAVANEDCDQKEVIGRLERQFVTIFGHKPRFLIRP